MSTSITAQIDAWIASYKNTVLTIEQDTEWPSPCELGQPDANGLIRWQPVLRDTPASFANVEHAMDISLHPDLVAFYTRYYADALDVVCGGEPCQLLQAWNDDDFERLQQNIIGHLLMKKRLKQTPTVFIGAAEDDRMITLNNQTGEIAWELPGKEAHQRIATDLASFLSSLAKN